MGPMASQNGQSMLKRNDGKKSLDELFFQLNGVRNPPTHFFGKQVKGFSQTPKLPLQRWSFNNNL